jgi:hypothetical protein
MPGIDAQARQDRQHRQGGFTLFVVINHAKEERIVLGMTESEFWTQGHIGLPKRGLTEDAAVALRLHKGDGDVWLKNKRYLLPIIAAFPADSQHPRMTPAE